jgi:GTPase
VIMTYSSSPIRTAIQVKRIQVLEKAKRERRNVCIIVHVDHGKTNLSDQLIVAAAAAPNTLSKCMQG